MFLVPDSYTEFSSVALSKVLGIFSFQGSSSCHVAELGAWIMAEKGQTWILSAHLKAKVCNICDCISPWIFKLSACIMSLNVLEKFRIWHLMAIFQSGWFSGEYLHKVCWIFSGSVSNPQLPLRVVETLPTTLRYLNGISSILKC